MVVKTRKHESRILGACASIITVGFVVCVAIISSHRRSELLLPWYDVASTGDGISPEVVNYWQVPPKYATAGLSSSYGSVQQDTTKWNGDHSLNGGNKEWAEEDGALHAYNMANWRIKVLQAQIQKQKLQWKLMHGQDDCTAASCGHQKAAEPQTLISDPNQIKDLEQIVAMQSEQIDNMQREIESSKGQTDENSNSESAHDVIKELEGVATDSSNSVSSEQIADTGNEEAKQLENDSSRTSSEEIADSGNGEAKQLKSDSDKGQNKDA